jgi:mersacidin/lichenicidin family type 2 lantibiotic
MSPVDVIRAWKDDAYRNSLSQEQRQQLPANPAGLVELSDEDMLSVSGGCTTCGNPLHTPVRSCKPSPFEEIAL